MNGEEWLLVRRSEVYKEIQAVIREIDAEACKTKVSNEKTMAGRLLYAPKVLNSRFKEEFRRLNWREGHVRYWVANDVEVLRRSASMPPADQKKEIEESGQTPIPSYNQTDFVKERVAVEVQFGKYSFIAFDLFVKHMAFYVGGKIDVGIEILPMKSMQAEMSSGPGYYERGLYDIARQGRGVPAVPLVLIGVVP